MASSQAVLVDTSNLESDELELELRIRNISLTDANCINILSECWKLEETGKRPLPDALPVDFQSPDDELKICQSNLDAIQPVVSVLIAEFNED